MIRLDTSTIKNGDGIFEIGGDIETLAVESCTIIKTINDAITRMKGQDCADIYSSLVMSTIIHIFGQRSKEIKKLSKEDEEKKMFNILSSEFSFDDDDKFRIWLHGG